MVEEGQKYILLNDRVGEKTDVSYFMTKSIQPTTVLKGEILKALPEDKQPKDSRQVLLVGVERKNITIKCSTTDLARVTHEEADLLLGISSALERYNIFHERNTLEAGKKIKETTKVFVKVKGLHKPAPGVVWYKGPLSTASGTMFGVELTEHRGYGTTNGEFRKHQYFNCQDDCGVFVSLDKLALQEDLPEQKKSSHSKLSLSPNKIISKFMDMLFPKSDNDGKQINNKKIVAAMSQYIGERVVTFIHETSVRGVLRTVFTNEQSFPMAGIELDKRMGAGTGVYNGKQHFVCKKDYAIFVPLGTVLPENDFDTISSNEQCNQRKRFSDGKARTGLISPEEHPYTSLVCDRTKTQEFTSKKELKRSISESSASSTTSTEEALRAAGVPVDKTFVKEQKQLFAQINQKKDNFNPEPERLDSAHKKLSFQENHFQVTNASRVSPTQTVSLTQTGKSQLVDPGMSNTDETQMVGMTRVSKEQHGSYSSVLSRGSTPPTVSFTSLHNNKDRMITRSMARARGQEVVADCDSKPSEPLIDKVVDETVNQMREDAAKINNINMETLPTPSSANVEADTNVNRTVLGSGFQSPKVEPRQVGLEVGTMVEIPLSNCQPTRYGVIRWIGHLPSMPGKLVAGLELEEEQSACSDGTFGGERYFTCPPGRGFFVLLQRCQRDSRFFSGPADSLTHQEKAFGSYVSPNVPGIVAPLERILESGYGRMKGIQGHHNSCYLDATLFSMFAFSSIFDSLLYRRKNGDDLEEYENVQKVLKDAIVNPLRSNGYVRADRVLELRELLDQLGFVTGLVNEEKDPEEFLNTLLQQVFKAEPFLHLKYNNRSEGAHFYQIILEKEEGIEVATLQSLLEQSFLAADIRLTEVPSCLILQMPRFGKEYKMYEHILISPVLDITHLVESVPHECVICESNVAEFECKQCSQEKMFAKHNRIIGLCRDCSDRLHNHHKRRDHQLTPIVIPREYSTFANGLPIQRQEMELFAVVCIQTSHYVAFVKCGNERNSPWCFFDSMADRKGERDGYNIPSVTPCPEVGDWLNRSDKQVADAKRDGKIPDLIKRLLGDAYLCFYQNREVAMYK